MPYLPKRIRLLYYIAPLAVALLFFSFSRNDFSFTPWYERLFWSILSPPQRLMTNISTGLSHTWQRYVALIDEHDENELLKKRVAVLEEKVIAGTEAEEENNRLRALLIFKRDLPAEKIAVRVIASDARAEFKSILIDKGSDDGIEPLMPVLGPTGLIGKVGKAGRKSARVLLITDPNSSVDVMIQRSRLRGLLVGAAAQTTLKPGYYLTRMEYLNKMSDIQAEDVVITSGFDGIFPPGIPVGSVANIEVSRDGIFKEASVIPYENMAEAQEILVLLKKPDDEEARTVPEEAKKKAPNKKKSSP